MLNLNAKLLGKWAHAVEATITDGNLHGNTRLRSHEPNNLTITITSLDQDHRIGLQFNDKRHLTNSS
jgi:hypothetical protein